MRFLLLCCLSAVCAFVPNLMPNHYYNKYIPKAIYSDGVCRSFEYADNTPKNNTSTIITSQFNIRVVGEITEENCAQLGDVLINCDNAARLIQKTENISNVISLHITSNGGSLMPALYICDLIQYLETDVHTFVDGYAASSASLISVCGNKRFITKHSSMLIHQLSADVSGKFVEIKDNYHNMEHLMNNVADIYLTKSNISLALLTHLLQHDKWLNSTTCLHLGMVDHIL